MYGKFIVKKANPLSKPEVVRPSWICSISKIKHILSTFLGNCCSTGYSHAIFPYERLKTKTPRWAGMLMC